MARSPSYNTNIDMLNAHYSRGGEHQGGYCNRGVEHGQQRRHIQRREIKLERDASRRRRPKQEFAPFEPVTAVEHQCRRHSNLPPYELRLFSSPDPSNSSFQCALFRPGPVRQPVRAAHSIWSLDNR
ncbi:hypothetical protein BDZ89DRAFT_752929 [Hymenopellis radicata]|nr:hypothetical protein BDZ89DRAFT_752929 [Hymenopellis radicata]